LDERTPDEEKKAARLWAESDDEDSAEVFTLPPLLGEDDPAEDGPDETSDKDVDGSEAGEDYEAMSFPQNLDDYEMNQYTGSTTHEYQGLA